jgi:hypothetical protein
MKLSKRLILQTRTRALDGTFRPLFERWHSGLVANHINVELKRAAAWTPQLLMLPQFIVEARKLLRP